MTARTTTCSPLAAPRARYVRFLDALPVTPRRLTEKYTPRADGATADTWDREA